MPPRLIVKNLKQPQVGGGAALGIAPAWPAISDLRALLIWIAGRISRALRSAAEARQRAIRDRRARHGATRLPDHLLRDIGVSRMEMSYGMRPGRARELRAVDQPATNASSHSPRLKVMMRSGSPSRQARSRTMRGACTTRR
jgi:uncharacterized protein YjiS (DUF1127 family)